MERGQQFIHTLLFPSAVSVFQMIAQQCRPDAVYLVERATMIMALKYCTSWFLRCFRDPIRVPRSENRVRTGCLTFSLKSNLLYRFSNFKVMKHWNKSRYTPFVGMTLCHQDTARYAYVPKVHGIMKYGLIQKIIVDFIAVFISRLESGHGKHKILVMTEKVRIGPHYCCETT